MIKHLGWFWQLWKNTKTQMSLLIVLTLVTIFAKTVFPIFLKYIIDDLESNYQLNNAYRLIIFFVYFAVFQSLCTAFLPLFRGYMNLFYATIVRNKYYKIFTQKDYTFFAKFRTGDLLTRLTDDVDGSWLRIHWYSCSGILRPLEASCLLIFTLSAMAYYSWELTLLTFLPLPFLVLIMARTEEKMLRYTDEKQRSTSRCNSILESCFSGIRVVKTTLSEKNQFNSYQNAIDDRIVKEKDFLKINQLIHLFAMLVNHCSSIIVIFAGSIFMMTNNISLGTLILFITYAQTLIEPIWTLSFFYASSKQIFRYVDRLIETENHQDLAPRPGNEVIKDFHHLELQKVHFKYYDGKEESIRGISFKLAKGEVLAVVGSVGAGKSTLLDLIMRDLSPTQGKILINNKTIDNYSTGELSNVLGYVRQKNILFSETIKQNIEMGDNFNSSEINKSLDISMIADEIKDFPNGLDTVLGQKGITLSGGQKQRLSVARSLIRNPQLLLMDDCTAAMDATTEKLFWEQIREHYPDMSLIVTTHRLTTACQADKILVLDNGSIKEFDTHQNLMAQNSLYRKIMIKEISPRPATA